MNYGGFHYLYGPVFSRRLGRSLGIDLVPFKTCTYDCIYCQLGRTTNKTTKRRSYVPIGEILKELKIKLAAGETPDYISIAGSGEPTLHSRIGELIGMVKNMTTVPVAVLTNGSLLHLPEVSNALMQADLVIPSLDAGEERMFQYVNRPHPDISFDKMVAGIIEFTRIFPREVWLEVLLVSGVTGLAADAKKIAAWTKKIGAKKIQLNTVCRPAAEEFACAVEKSSLKNLAGLFPGAVDVVGEKEPVYSGASALQEAADEEIAQLLARRPCTISDVCSGLGLHPHEAAKKIKKLVDEKRIAVTRKGRNVFYRAAESARS